MLAEREPRVGWRTYAVRLSVAGAFVLVIAGWLAAFSTIGAVFILAGAALFLLAAVLAWSARGAVLAALAIVASLFVLPVVLGLIIIIGNALLKR